MYATRVTNLSESITIAISTLARELKAQGKDILSFSAGEPDFDTPQIIKDEAIKALQNGFTKYTAVAGIPELLQAISDKLLRENHLNYTPQEIVVNSGAKHSLFNIFQALIDKDDEVIIPSPYWVTYPELVTYSGGKNVFIETTQENNFKITPKQLKAAITPKTKMLVLTTPSNPTGMVYSKSELESIAEILKNTNIWVISDEIYEKLLPILSNSFQFLHQKAKGKLEIARVQINHKNFSTAKNTLNEALYNITRAIKLAERYPSAKNIEDTILHMTYTKGRILIEFSCISHRYVPQAVETCYESYQKQSGILYDAYDFTTGTGHDKKSFERFKRLLIYDSSIKNFEDLDLQKMRYLLKRWTGMKFSIRRRKKQTK